MTALLARIEPEHKRGRHGTKLRPQLRWLSAHGIGVENTNSVTAKACTRPPSSDRERVQVGWLGTYTGRVGSMRVSGFWEGGLGTNIHRLGGVGGPYTGWVGWVGGWGRVGCKQVLEDKGV
jgi:hypothetical protein